MQIKSLLSVGLQGLLVQASIWPVPKKLSEGDKVLFIDQTLDVTYNGDNLQYTYGYGPKGGAEYNSKDVVQGAVSRALTTIFRHNFNPWMLHMREEEYEPKLERGKQRWMKSLKITQTEEDSKDGPLTAQSEDVKEAYNLTVSDNGEAWITAPSSIGIMRALETFTQLFYQHSAGTYWYMNTAPISIQDEPKYSHRGLLMDVARTYLPVEDILKTIDGLAAAKMNKLHIHATDSQSWPLEIPALPELAQKGRYAPGLTYTPEDVQYIHNYAINRGIQIIVEIDMPSHTGSIALAYPELVVAYNEQPYHWWCVQPPCGQVKMNSSEVYDFLDTMWEDFLPRVVPYTAYFHTGGDEFNANDSMLDEGVRSNDTEVLQPLLQTFIDKAHKNVRDRGLAPMVWEEMALEWNITMEEDVVVQAWLGSESIKEITGMGHKVIDTNNEFWYLDCGRGQWQNFDNGLAFDTFYPFNDWCSPAKGWRLIYTHDPADGLDEKEAALVLGGEVAAWSETIDRHNLDTILWPRAAAAGEVLWSGNKDAEGNNRTQLDTAPRLSEFRERLIARGIGSAPVHMTFCTQHSPEECSYPL